MVGGFGQGEGDAVYLLQQIVGLAVGHNGRPVLAIAMVQKQGADIGQFGKRTEEDVLTVSRNQGVVIRIIVKMEGPLYLMVVGVDQGGQDTAAIMVSFSP